MTENVEVAVIGSQFEEDVFRAVPLVEYFLDKIFAPTHLKANWPFVCLAACITLNVDPHRHIVAVACWRPRQNLRMR
jgi:beta-phosphoglucomutase-like phosphatase (HAD superfamily)